MAGATYEPLSQSIARDLRDAILEGRLAPGEWIRQEAVAKELGTSRIPVREALAQLEIEGLITIVPHSGARVARLGTGEMTELYRLREALEPLAIAQAVPYLDDAGVEALRALAGGDDRTFHLATYAPAPMPRLHGMIADLWNGTQQYQRLYLGLIDARETEANLLEHLLLIDALERRDPVDAQRIVASHLKRTRETLSRHPDSFP